MIVDAVYFGKIPIERIYFGKELIFQAETAEPVVFHVIEDGKLIILGAHTINDLPSGLYLDCAPEASWIYPVQNGNTLTIEQVYSATQNGNALGVE